jgi:hypothetical protein
MTTARQICEGAAEEIYVKNAEVALEAGDFQIFFVRMNDMLLEWADSGLTPAFVEVFNGDDTVLIDSNARAAVKYSLAVRCAPAFQKPLTQGLVLLRDESVQKLEASTDFIGEVAYPDTLPLGSGNRCPDDSIDQRFFPAGKKENF